MKPIAILILLLIAMMPAVAAELVVNKYTNDFTASSPYNEQIKMCGCETKVDRIIVENTGNFYANFRISLETGYPRGMRIVPEEFELAPKHFKEVLVYIEDSCNLEGTFDYNVIVTNSYGRAEKILRTIDVQPCQTTGLKVTPESITTGTCEPATFEVTVENIGSYKETYSLDFGEFNGVATAELQAFMLEPGEELRQDVEFLLHCAQYGEFTIPFTARPSKGSPAHTTRPLTITNDYGYALALDTRIEVCADAQTQIPVTLENQARLDTIIDLRLDAPPFVEFEGEGQMALPAFEEREIVLEIRPGREHIGTHEIRLAGTDVYGGIAKERTASLEVKNCFDPGIELRTDAVTLAPEEIETCCGQKTFYVNLRNNGDREQLFRLEIDGPSFFVLDETTVRVAPSQNVNVPVRATLPCADETYGFAVHAWPIGQESVNVSAQLTIESQTQRTCHMVQIDKDEIVVREDQSVIPVIVKHTGIEGGNYSLEMENELFSVHEDSISLEPGEQRAIHFIAREDLSLKEKGRYIAQPDLVLQDLGIEYKEHVGVELKGKGLFQRLADWFTGLPWSSITVCGWIVLVLLIVLIVLIALLAIQWATGAFFPDGLEKGTLTLLRTLIAVLALILIVTLVFIEPPGREMRFERLAASQNATVLEWYQNEELTVDLDRYFDDPDRDDLVYTATQPDDISAVIDENMMTLAPDHNFAGENTLVVTASDERGGVADSPIFLLRVIPRKDLGFLGWLGLWCVFIGLGLGIAILAVFFLFTLSIKERREEPYRKHVLVVVRPEEKARGAVRRTSTRSAARRAVRKKPARKKGRVAKSAKASKRSSKTSRKSSSKGGGKAASRKSSKKSRKKVARKSVKKSATARSRKAERTSATAVPALRAEPVRAEPLPSEFSPQDRSQTVNIAVGSPGQPAEETVYVGSKTGNSVHLPGCIMASRIPKDNRVAFGSKREALKEGLVPCKICRPF